MIPLVTLALAVLVPATTPPPPPSTPPAADAPATTLDPLADGVLSPPVGAALDDVVGWLADPGALDAARFSDEFLAEVPVEDVRAGLASLGGGEWTVQDIQEVTDSAIVATLRGPERSLSLQLEVDDAGRVVTLFFENAGLAELPPTLPELVQQLAPYGEQSGFLAADVDAAGACQAVEAAAADQPLPLGSAFKLYVLGALAGAVEAGDVAWDQAVTVRDELDSLPLGTTQDEPAGSTLPVRELAQRMIEVSDNTATDHLVDLLGRAAVEASLAELGHSDPAITVPFLTTRELFVLKSDADLLARYEAADEAGRRALLDGEVAAAALPALDAVWTEPRAVTTVEWFATPADVCTALVRLDDLGGQPGLEPIREILSTNPGMVVDPAVYEQVLFKGGSEPGVLYGAWLGRRLDGSRVVVTGGVASTTDVIDPAAIELIGAGLTLV